MRYFRKTDPKALILTLLVHVLLILLLFILKLTAPERPADPEEGIPVMLGNMEQAGGMDEPDMSQSATASAEQASSTASEISPAPSEKPSQPTPKPTASETPKPKPAEKLITQKEKSAALPSDDKQKALAEQQRKAAEQERRALAEQQRKAAEQKRLAEQEAARKKQEAARKAEEERQAKARAEAARKAEAERQAAAKAKALVSGKFGAGQGNGNRGTTTDQGTQGTPMGNSSTGAMQGNGARGNANVPNRKLVGPDPYAAYPGQEEGNVTVRITVNAAGQVTSAAILPSQTNTSDARLRNAALTAARKARFNAVSGAANVQGTITFRFRLR